VGDEKMGAHLSNQWGKKNTHPTAYAGQGPVSYGVVRNGKEVTVDWSNGRSQRENPPPLCPITNTNHNLASYILHV